MLAELALQFGRYTLEMESGAFGDRAFADKVPVELNGIINDGGELTNDQIQIRNPIGAGLPRMAQSDLQNAFSNHKFMHSFLAYIDSNQLYINRTTLPASAISADRHSQGVMAITQCYLQRAQKKKTAAHGRLRIRSR